MKKRMFEVVPLAEAMRKLDEEAAQKIRGDSGRNEDPPEIQAGRPHRSIRPAKEIGPATRTAVAAAWRRD